MNNIAYSKSDEKFEIVRGNGELFLSIADSLDFVRYCDEHDLAIIGVEGGIFVEGVFTPDLDMLFDLSNAANGTWVQYRGTCNDYARLFLSTFLLRSELRFYLTFTNESDFERW